MPMGAFVDVAFMVAAKLEKLPVGYFQRAKAWKKRRSSGNLRRHTVYKFKETSTLDSADDGGASDPFRLSLSSSTAGMTWIHKSSESK